jgi:cell division protein FtsB
MKEFDIEKLERKNIYKVPDDMFNSIQERVMNDVKANKKAPIFKLNWVYAVAASLALIFGVTFVYNSDQNQDTTKESGVSEANYAKNDQASKTESEIAYETLKSDLNSVENTDQIVENKKNRNSEYSQDNETENITKPQIRKPAPKQTDAKMNEYLDSFSNTEIAELAKNSTEDVYLDLYN